MKKRIILCSVIIAILIFIILAMEIDGLRTWLLGVPFIGDLCGWVKENFYDFYYAVKFGPHRFAFIVFFSLLFIAFVVFVMFNTPKMVVKETKVVRVPVTQQPIIKTCDGKPSTVICEESKGE